jgi:hypothetical protein
MKDPHPVGLNVVTSFVWFLFTTRRGGSLNPCKLGARFAGDETRPQLPAYDTLYDASPTSKRLAQEIPHALSV